MSQSDRNSISGSGHGRRVAVEARTHDTREYLIEADILGYPQPGTIDGYMLDVIAQKDSCVSIAEVETAATMNNKHALGQSWAFRRACRHKNNWHFQRVVPR